MMKRLVLLTLAASLLAGSRSLLANSSPISLSDKEAPMMLPGGKAMTTKTVENNVLIKSISLLVREERSVPLGSQPSRDRDIGFASVFVQFENTRQEPIVISIDKIEVQNTLNGKIQLSDRTPKQIHLRPLEISANHFQLTNKTGFSNFGKVKAIVTYKINQQTYTVESTPIKVERY
jgi:hypothetical protein